MALQNRKTLVRPTRQTVRPVQFQLAIVGRSGGTNLGSSFLAAAQELGYEALFYNDLAAYSCHRWINALLWRFADRRPAFLNRFEQQLTSDAAMGSFTILISSGIAPISRRCLAELASLGVRSLHFSSDDPWNPSQRSRWFLQSLSAYHYIFTPRQANFEQLQEIAPGRVSILPFGFDRQATLHHIAELGAQQTNNQVLHAALSTSLLFVGGADRSRVAFVRLLKQMGVPVLLVGAYWSRHHDLQVNDLGHQPPIQVARYTQAACVNLILVRKQNRDGHTMRTFEAAALAGCLLVEDTLDHRQLFGPESECVLYFQDALSCAQRFRKLQAQPDLRTQLANAAHQRLWTGHHTYADRLQTMLATF